MRAALLLIGVAGLAGCGRDSGTAPATGPVVEDRRLPGGYRLAVANYLREARSAADVLDRSPPPPTAADAKRLDELYGRLPPAPLESERKADLEVLLKRISEETTLGATWVSKLYEASRGAKAGEEPELAKKYGESLKEAVKTARDRADQVEAVLRTDQ